MFVCQGGFAQVQPGYIDNPTLDMFVEFHKPKNDQARAGKYRKSLFAEALGSGLGLSGNFDTGLLRTGMGLGAFYTRVDAKGDVRYVTVPFMVNHVFGKKRSGLETGLGFTPQIAFSKVAAHESSFILHGTASIGYRLPLRDGLMVRATLNPLVGAEGFYPWAGVSIGYSFQ